VDPYLFPVLVGSGSGSEVGRGRLVLLVNWLEGKLNIRKLGSTHPCSHSTNANVRWKRKTVDKCIRHERSSVEMETVKGCFSCWNYFFKGSRVASNWE